MLTVADKINAARNAALASLGAAPHSKCPTCGGADGAPFRVYGGSAERHRVISGCVDSFHHGHLVTPSESAMWHYRPGAEAIRREEWKRIKGKGR